MRSVPIPAVTARSALLREEAPVRRSERLSEGSEVSEECPEVAAGRPDGLASGQCEARASHLFRKGGRSAPRCSAPRRFPPRSSQLLEWSSGLVV